MTDWAKWDYDRSLLHHEWEEGCNWAWASFLHPHILLVLPLGNIALFCIKLIKTEVVKTNDRHRGILIIAMCLFLLPIELLRDWHYAPFEAGTNVLNKCRRACWGSPLLTWQVFYIFYILRLLCKRELTFKAPQRYWRHWASKKSHIREWTN